MSAFPYLQVLKLSAPALVLTAGALCIVVADAVVMSEAGRAHRRMVGGVLGAMACLAAGLVLRSAQAAGALPLGMLVADPLVGLVQFGILGLAGFTCLASVGSDVTDHVGEYVGLILLAAVGALLLAATENLLVLFTALELMSLCLYALAAMQRRGRASAEAGLKYFLVGSTAAAFLLFGMSWLYGLTGTLELRGIARSLAGRGMDPLLVGAMVLMLGGLGFKLAAVPFHLWAPDVYEGAPAPSAAFIASASKLASVFVLGKLVMVGWAEARGGSGWGGFAAGWTPLVALMAALSMVLGNLAALVQKNVKRLLAWSAVAQAGYLLTGMLADDGRGLAAVLFYSMVYAAGVLGAFAVVAVVERGGGDAGWDRFRGLGRRSPLMAACLAVFLLSLAGLPPTAGFLGKFYLFAAVLQGNGGMASLWLVIVGFGMSAVSFYYYLSLLKVVYGAQDEPCEPAERPGETEVAAAVGLALVVLGLGLGPDLLLGALRHAAAVAGF